MILSDEEMAAIVQKMKAEAYKFSENYETALSEKNWNPNRPADRDRYFIISYLEEIIKETSKAQAELTAREIFEKLDKFIDKNSYPEEDGFEFFMTNEDYQALKSSYLEDKVND